jgi:hypothetical protein
MSWDWQYNWWLHCAQSVAGSLRLLGIYTADGRLLGLAPFYSHEVRVRGIRVQRLELMGLSWRAPDGVFSEYLDVIVRRTDEHAALTCIARWLERNRFWDELAMPYVRPDSLARKLASEFLAPHAHVREVDPASCYSVRLRGSFSEYVQRLNPRLRRKIVHQRSKLLEPRLELASEQNIAGYLESLRSLERLRWGVTNDRAYRFNLALAAARVRSGALRLTRLSSAGRTLSVMLNVRVNGTEYYLQSAFDPSLSRGISPGYLHFGHVIEECCRDGIGTLELLAGRGRNRDYKRDFLADCSTLVSYHVIGTPWLRVLYRAYDRLVAVRGSAQ